MKLFIIGFMGSGKTLIAKMLGDMLNLQCIDLDKCIERDSNRTINKIFKTNGEVYFRQLENEQIINLESQDDLIIATGGGTPCYFNNIELMNRMGTTVYLKTDKKILFKRLTKERTQRPLIRTIPMDNLENYIEEKLRCREQFYSEANIILDTNNLPPEKICEEIIANCY